MAASGASSGDGNDRAAPLLQGSASELPRTSSGRSSMSHKKAGLGMLSVAAIVFFNVSGGPLGSEQVISSVGPLYGLGSLVAFTTLYSVPQAMMTAELSTAFPDNGGYSLWVQAAFGDLWGVQESYWSWFSGVVDSALYPVLLYSCAEQLFLYVPQEGGCRGGGDDDGEDLRNLWTCMFTDSSCAREYAIKLAVLVVFIMPNVISDHIVGHGLFFLALFVMAPFIVTIALSLRSAQFSLKRLLGKPRKQKWSLLLSVAYWNVSGFDSASTFAGEIGNPQRTLPRALGLAVVIMVLGYVLTLSAAAAVDPDWRCWQDGSITHVAGLVGGHWLAIWVLVSATLGNWGLFCAELIEDSYQLLGMAELGLAPAWFARRHPRLHTPLNAILLQLLIIGVLVGLDFNAILCVDNFFSASSAALEFLAAVRLRSSKPDMPRPYRIPLSTPLLALFFVLPIAANVVVMYVTAVESPASFCVTMAATSVGFIGYFVMSLFKSHFSRTADGVADTRVGARTENFSFRPEEMISPDLNSSSSLDDGADGRGSGGGYYR